MNFFNEGINELIIQIKKIYKNTKEMDILSLLYLLYFSLYLLMLPSFLLSFNFLSISIKLIMIIMIMFCINKFILKTNKILTFKKLVISIIISFILIIIIYKTYFHILLLISMLLLVILFLPFLIGSGKYFLILQNIRYLGEIYTNQSEIYLLSRSPHKNFLKFLLIIFCCILIAISINKIFNLPYILSILLAISLLILFILRNKNKNKVHIVFQKFLFLILLLLIQIYANIKIEINTIKFLSLIATFYFSIDRIFSISKEVTQLIKSESILYYYEHKNIPKKILLEEIIEIKYIDKEISEIELVKQILLRRRLNLKDELLELINMYKKARYTEYLQLVESIKYFIFTKLNELENIKSLKKKIKKIINLKNQKINPIEIYLEYAYILFEINKYFESIKYYEKYFEYLSKEELLVLYKIYIKVNKLNKAQEIKEHLIL